MTMDEAEKLALKTLKSVMEEKVQLLFYLIF